MVVFDPESGHVDSLKTSSTPEHARPGDRQRPRRGRRPRRVGRDVHPRHDRRDERADRAHRLQGRIRDHERASRTRRSSSASTGRCSTTYAGRSRSPSSRAGGSASGSAERLDADGSEVRPIDEDEVRELCRTIRESGAEAVALSLLFSYVSTDHEERVKEILAEELPGVPVSVSLEVAPIWREYERCVDDDRRRVPAAAVPPLRREPRRLAARRRDDARVDDHEVERRRDALRRGRGGADPDRDVRARPAG